MIQSGWTPLHIAAQTSTVEDLLAAKADVHVQSQVCTSLPTSVVRVNVGGGLKLREGELDGEQDGSTPLHTAAGMGYTTNVEALLKAGAAVDHRDHVRTSAAAPDVDSADSLGAPLRWKMWAGAGRAYSAAQRGYERAHLYRGGAASG